MIKLMIALNSFFGLPAVAGAISGWDAGSKLIDVFRFLKSKLDNDSIEYLLLNALDNSLNDASNILGWEYDHVLLHEDLINLSISGVNVIKRNELKHFLFTLTGMDVGEYEVDVLTDCFDKNVASNARLFHYLTMKWMRSTDDDSFNESRSETDDTSIVLSIGIDGVMADTSVINQNRLLTWLVTKQQVSIIIHDERIMEIKSRNEIYQSKMKNGYVLSDNEQLLLRAGYVCIDMLENERIIKEKACAIFLRDSSFLGYMNFQVVGDVLKFIKRIVDLQYKNEMERRRNLNDYSFCDIYLRGRRESDLFSFSVSIPKSAIVNAFSDYGQLSHGKYFMFDITDFDKDTFMDIASFFYYEMASFILSREEKNITFNKDILNLLCYHVCGAYL